MKKDHYVETWGYAAVVRTVLDDFKALGHKIPKDATAALELVEAWLQGKEITSPELQAAADLSWEDGVPYPQREKDRATGWARGAAGNLAWYAKKDRGWQTGGKSILDAAEYTLSSLNIPGVKDHKEIEKLFKAAVKKAVPPKNKPAKKAPKPLSTNLSAFIGAAANKRLQKLKPTFDMDSRADADTLKALLEKNKYKVHDAVMSFDARYGGLVAADSPGEEGDDWIFGAYACLTSGAHKDPRGEKPDWVPVAYSPNDYIIYLDSAGVAWIVDTVGDSGTEKFADDGDAFITRFAKG